MASFSRARFKKDTGLVTRMYFTMFMLGILYGVFALFLMAVNFPIILIGVIVALLVGVQYFLYDRMIMWSTGAKQVDRSQEPELFAMVERVAMKADMPMPKVAVINSMVPNAFATGRNPKNALVAVTVGIRQRLSDRELEAVMAHEIAHVRNRDMRVLAVANFLVTITSFLMTMLFWNMLFGGFGRRQQSGGIMLVYLVTILVYFLGQLLVLARTRYREYGADHSGAEISGDPGALANALEKISGSMARIPDEDLRKLQTASAFMIIPAALKGESAMNLFSTHPPVEDRIRRLRELERRARWGMR